MSTYSRFNLIFRRLIALLPLFQLFHVNRIVLKQTCWSMPWRIRIKSASTLASIKFLIYSPAICLPNSGLPSVENSPVKANRKGPYITSRKHNERFPISLRGVLTYWLSIAWLRNISACPRMLLSGERVWIRWIFHIVWFKFSIVRYLDFEHFEEQLRDPPYLLGNWKQYITPNLKDESSRPGNQRAMSKQTIGSMWRSHVVSWK